MVRVPPVSDKELGSFFRVVLMQEMVSGSLLFLVQEQMKFSTLPRLQTQLAVDSGCFEQTRLVWMLEGVIREVQYFDHEIREGSRYKLSSKTSLLVE